MANKSLATLLAVGALTVGVVSAAPAAAAGTTVSTRTTTLGLIAVGASHRTVYLFTKDDPGVSHCGPTCRQTWHRVKTDGKPVAGTGISASHLGQTSKHQVTYYGHPLYYFSGDGGVAGRTRGQGRIAFGGRWWVVSPEGKAGTGARVRLHSTPDGTAIAGPLGSGRTLYMLTSDGAKTTTCTGSCTATWPPLITTGKPRAASGVTASLLSSLVRSDGRRQVTYNGHPLYYYANDYSAGTDYGQCLPQGATARWYILRASGAPNTSCV
ncbi:MAG TPA: hypothetical protein VFJ98_04630 [Mycobacteriales bacterium]|nr:hypothetical protein [Mycobacteriales bacterium]